jgi:2-oxoglutarate ferredoxin oxidoreductase subunit alpha
MREYIDGASAIVRGALDAGCTFFAGYPITPASGILMQMMRELPKTGGVAIQGEDEIASIGMCIGATLAGGRAMTATSGPGISLYSENIGLAVMGEVPLVVVDVQRLGPATGGATTVGQGDVQFVRWGTSGGYPIIALAPTDAADAYRLTVRAFDLAERFRCPVFVLTDKDVAMTPVTIDPADLRAARPPARSVTTHGEPYRYQPPGVLHPLHEYGRGATVRFTGSTHDERAFITKDRATIRSLNTHLVAKIEDHVEEIELVETELEPGARTLIVSYGVVAGAAEVAARAIRRTGHSVSTVVVRSIWPVPEAALAKAMVGVDRIVVPELNPGLYRREIDRVADHGEVIGVNRIDGHLIDPKDIMEAAW